MKKGKCEIWLSQARHLFHALRFSTLDAETQTCINHELFYFNHSRCVVIPWAIMLLEAINVVNVLFFSSSGLTTQNNRQYFSMYLLLMASGAACLFLRRLLQNHPIALSKCYIGFTTFWLWWHAMLSSMDLRYNPSITVYISGIFGLTLLIRLKPWQTFSILSSSLLLLFFCARSTISSGIALNALIVTLVAMLVSCSRYFSTLEELGYRQKMVLQADHRTKEQQRIKLLKEQQRRLLYYSRELLFLWDKAEDSLLLSTTPTPCEADTQTLLAWLLKCDQRTEGIVALQLNHKNSMQTYSISCTPLLDNNGTLFGAVGRLELKECVGG